MHIQPAFLETRQSTLHELISRYPLGALVMSGPDGLQMNHMPFLLLPEQGKHGMLQAHVPRNNPVVELPGQEAMVLFQGPNAYISPNWYPSKHQHGKAVPTWNYAVVHAHGRPRFIRDKAWLLEHVNALTTKHEADQPSPWQVADAPAQYIERMLDSIVGIELSITRLTGKFKMNQNRPEPDRRGVATHLSALQDDAATAVAALVREHI